MEGLFYTLQDFFTHSKGVTYVLMGLALLAFVAIWNFLVSREEDEYSGEGWEMHE
jgi:hypothetical protein